MINLVRISCVGLLCALAAAMQAQPVPPAHGGAPVVQTPVSVSLRTDKKSYAPKDPIKLTLTVKCPSKTPVKLMFGSGMKYDFEIRKGKAPASEKIWQWARGRMFAQMVTFTTVEPSKPLVFTETFAPGDKGADGKAIEALSPGAYTVSGTLALSGRAPRPTATATFTVK